MLGYKDTGFSIRLLLIQTGMKLLRIATQKRTLQDWRYLQCILLMFWRIQWGVMVYQVYFTMLLLMNGVSWLYYNYLSFILENWTRDLCWVQCSTNWATRTIYYLWINILIYFLSFPVPEVGPANLTAYWNKTDYTIHVTWSQIPQPLVHGYLTHYVITYSNATFTATKTSRTNSSVLTGLLIFTEYTIKVAGVTRVGTGGNSSIVFRTRGLRK